MTSRERSKTPPGDDLLRTIARLNWAVLLLLVLASLAWRSLSVSGGVLAGGLLVIGGYHWRHRALKRLLIERNGSRIGFQLGYLGRLLLIGGAIYLLIARAGVPPLALVAGLSTVVVSLLLVTVKRMF
ncbi:MAG: hypothetical protein D6794_12135 [Deltaproteobacteria bacterium]|nr:MAG: hypothetical protein D6794_12135 [Deltaproteobacteria bacterium]